jgi:hypothetical protein
MDALFSPAGRSFEDGLGRIARFHLSSDDDIEFDDRDDVVKTLQESNWLDELVRTGSAVCSVIANNNKLISKLLPTPLEPVALPPPVEVPPKGESTPGPRGSSYEDVITKRSQLLKAEPFDGLIIAVQAPGLPWFSRHFAPDATGDSIYLWIAAQPEIIESGLKYGAFELIGAAPQNRLLAVTRTLTDQNVQSWSVFRLKRTL